MDYKNEAIDILDKLEIHDPDEGMIEYLAAKLELIYETGSVAGIRLAGKVMEEGFKENPLFARASTA